jgi:5-methylcytosine-specific restriction protein A
MKIDRGSGYIAALSCYEELSMRAFAKAFYESPAWRSTRAYIFKRDSGLCVRCGAPGEIVHHKQELTPTNINDPMISLNENNLETLCRACHAIAHGAVAPIADGLAFDTDGNIIPAELARKRIDDDEYA